MNPVPAHSSQRSRSLRTHPSTTTHTDPSAAGAADAASSLGPRLREIRLRHGVGLRELARRLDLSPSAISGFENGKMQPSVRTLYAFASEFQVTVDEVLFDRGDQPDDDAPVEGSDSSTGVAEPGLEVQRAEASPVISLNSGVTWKRLMFWADEDVEFIEATYEPGGASSPDGELVRHNGHEFGHVLSGTLRVVVGFDEFVLNSGDSLTFPSSTPHLLSNDGKETVRALWVVRGRRGA
jgi:transcriptional regulator with XRE-family HTH domain